MGLLGIRNRLCYEIARRMLDAPREHQVSVDGMSDWRQAELEVSWQHFDDADIRGKEVLDFGCGYGNLSFFLCQFEPKHITGVELGAWIVAEANRRRLEQPHPERLSFVEGAVERIPCDDHSLDTILAFDVMEHVMEPERIMAEWYRVLRPGGKVLISWYPFRGPFGPHMESLVPIPWAHIFFGEEAMFHTAEKIYDSPNYAPRMWDYEDDGVTRKPNKWKSWRSFDEQGYINKLTIHQFREIAEKTGFAVPRLEPHTFQGTPVRRAVGSSLLKVPVVSELVTNFIVAELQR